MIIDTEDFDMYVIAAYDEGGHGTIKVKATMIELAEIVSALIKGVDERTKDRVLPFILSSIVAELFDDEELGVQVGRMIIEKQWEDDE